MRLLHVIGTRPNMVKMAPVVGACRRRDGWRNVLVHTGQHYDRAMSDVFLEELGMPEPDHLLGVGSGSHAQQTARVIERLEPILEAERPDLVLVPGDVNSTLAAALAAAKLGIAVAHVEAGLRSFDPTMPEELNRRLTDQVSELLFVHSPEATENLEAEGIASSRIHPVGNTMIDTLVALSERIEARRAHRAHDLPEGGYLLVTLHRPALVDGPLLERALQGLATVARSLPVVFPVHPRTGARVEGLGLRDVPGLSLIEPQGYLDFLSLMRGAAGVLTDSGGIQEETTYLGVRCFTLRDNTERPVTLEMGTNVLLGLDPDGIERVPELLERAREAPAEEPPGWDGRAAERLADVVADW